MTTTALAGLVKCDDSYLTHLEKNRKTPRPRMVDAIASALGVNPEWLTGKTDHLVARPGGPFHRGSRESVERQMNESLRRIVTRWSAADPQPPKVAEEGPAYGVSESARPSRKLNRRIDTDAAMRANDLASAALDRGVTSGDLAEKLDGLTARIRWLIEERRKMESQEGGI